MPRKKMSTKNHLQLLNYLLPKDAAAARRLMSYWVIWCKKPVNKTSESLRWHFMWITGTGLAGRMNTAALVERGIKTGVKRGENSGRILRHENVVRIFNTLDLNSGVGTATLQIPDNVKRSKASIIAYIQDPDSRKLQELNAWTCTNAIVFG